MADVGYIRVSTVDQSTARQLDGISLDKTFEDKVSGASCSRPALKECLNYLREGDVLHVHSIDRLARNLDDLQNLVSVLTDRGVVVQFHSENLTFCGGPSSPMQTLLFQIMGAFAQFERALIKERQREGFEQARAKGKHVGRPAKLTERDRETILTSLENGVMPSALAKEYGVSVSTIHKLRAKAHLQESNTNEHSGSGQ